ncbi:SAM-dependent methyltransferase [Nakamurella lactea]|uniref:SAM-dependent methyltransferase n=1 Tax=Nakamurella lactea TaxID=459515 RepID=UPI00042A513C|nr:class I SAM-dependent methyltransferase [Nakamurella lactea]
MTYTETDLVATIEQLAGTDLASLTQAQRDGIDQFHAGGTAAVDRLLPSLRLSPAMTVLDVGSGLGGPARQIARTTGCQVVGVDLAAGYVEAATALTDAVGLAGQARFLNTDIARLDRFDFDAACTVHTQMNVADKETFFAAIAHRLRPGARLATFEVCRVGNDDPALPLPWTIDGTDSFLATPAELMVAIEDGGFDTVEWVDETPWLVEWFQQLGARLAAGGTAATLPALLDDGPERMRNFAGALGNGTLTVHRGAFTVQR